METQKINIDELLEEYSFSVDIFTDISDRLLDIYPKWNNLDRAEKTLIVLYAEFRSYRKVGNILGISHTTVVRFINQIRNRLC